MKEFLALCAVTGGLIGFFIWLSGEGHETWALLGASFVAGCAIAIANIMDDRL